MGEIVLRDYQQKAVDEIQESFKRHQYVLFVLATAGGKTFCFSYITKKAGEKGKSVMIMAHRSELISQASLSLAQMGVKHQIIAPKSLVNKIKLLHLTRLGSNYVDPFSHVSVGSVQTIGRRLDKVARPDLLIPDEAHHCPAGMWKKVIDYFDTKTLGVTATPCRSDGVGLGAVFSDMVMGKSMADLLADGNLCPYDVYSTPEEIDFGEIKRVQSGESKGDYNARDLEKQMDKPKIVGRAVEHYEKYAKGTSCLVFAVSISHAEHIAQEFRNAGYNFIAVSGKTDDSERYKAVDDLRDKRIDGIVNCDLFGEGTDITGVESVIMMRPISELAFSLFAQQVGRALRLAEGKERAIILDMTGNFVRHGFPEDKTDWTLDDREKKKKGAKDEDSIKVKTCPECFSTHKPEPSCPMCGYQYPIAAAREYEQVEGDLIELERQEQKESRRISQNAGIRSAKTKADLYAVDDANKMKRGAAAHKKQAMEEKKKAIVRMKEMFDYYKEHVAWGDPAVFGDIMQSAFNVSEQDAKKYGAIRINRLCDDMRELAQLRSSEAKPPYSSLNYKLAFWGDNKLEF